MKKGEFLGLCVFILKCIPCEACYSLFPAPGLYGKIWLISWSQKRLSGPLFTFNAFNQVELKAKAGIKENAHFQAQTTFPMFANIFSKTSIPAA